MTKLKLAIFEEKAESLSVDDYLVRKITKDYRVRVLACVTINLVNAAYRRQDTYPTAAAALGRALTAGAPPWGRS